MSKFTNGNTIKVPVSLDTPSVLNTVKYTVGDATAPEGDGLKIIAHVCNDIGAWGAGFVLALSRRWKKPEESYRQMSDEDRTLGNVRLIGVEDDIIVANMIAQKGIGPAKDGTPPIRYHALRMALKGLNEVAIELGMNQHRRVSLHMPRIGCGLAGGDWSEVEQIIRECTTIPVVVYDLP